MLEQELNPAASKFISSLVKSLQLLCNGHVDYSESIELIGHINVRVDRVHKYDYIVDEHVSKEGSNSSTFLSNSYYSHHPSKPLPAPKNDVQSNSKQDTRSESLPSHGSHTSAKVSHKMSTACSRKQDDIMVKMEGNDDDCMVLPASPEDYEPVDVGPQDAELPGTSSAASESYEMDYGIHHNRHSNQTSKKRKAEETSNQEGDICESKVKAAEDYDCYPYEQEEDSSSYMQCYQCGQWFYDVGELHFHQSTCHSNPSFKAEPWSGGPGENQTESEACSCTICGQLVSNSRERLQHMNEEHGITIYPCPSCSEVFGSSRSLSQHKRIQHGDALPQLQCTMCEKSFTTHLNLKGHMNMHLGLKPYTCKYCGEAFAYSQSKHRHQKFCSRTRNSIGAF